MTKPFLSITEALQRLQQGKMLILVDDERREYEGDVIIAAEFVTPEVINFMATHARGLICLALDGEIINRLQLPMMPERNKLPNQAPFTISIEAAKGVTSGTSAFDRAHTIRVVMDGKTQYQDLTSPGHVFPLRADPDGVLKRPGHTEGSTDLMALASLKKGAVICEIMNDDGSMARLPELIKFSEQHDIGIISIDEIITHRLLTDSLLDEVVSTPLHLESYGDFTLHVCRNRFDQTEHIALQAKQNISNQPALVRIHSECLTGDIFGSSRCDCGYQLKKGLSKISQEGGVLLYLRQEGRGIGLSNKIKAYNLQHQGLDTVEANEKLGFLADHRDYAMAAQMLKYLNIHTLRLMTNNPHKIQELTRFGMEIVERVPIEMAPTSQNFHYLKTKRDKLGHLLKLK